MKRVLVIITFLLFFITTSCACNRTRSNENIHNTAVSNTISPTDVSNTPKPTDVSTIYTISNFENGNIEPLENTSDPGALTKDGKLPDVLSFGFDVDEKQQAEFIKSYLQEREMYKEVPDGVSYYNGKNIAEYYIDKEKRKICFVLRVLGSAPYDGRFCITMNMDDMKEIANLTYRYDKKNDIVNESLYDINGKQAAHISYRYIPEVPFPFITEYEDVNNYKEAIGDVLYRSQKFWLYENMAKFNKSGKWIGYNTDLYEPDRLRTNYVFSYDRSDRLKKIAGRLSQTDTEKYLDKDTLTDFKDADKSEIKLSYQDNGNLDTITYFCSQWVYGTYGSDGNIHYDEEGRMIYEDAYVTHGTFYNYYFYNDDEKIPWACIYVDSMPYSGSVKDGIEYDYGQYYSIYLYEPINAD
jgi:hypothetical protein